MNDMFDTLIHLLDSAYGLPGTVLTLVFCIALGYFLKMMAWIPNRWIPSVVVPWGMLWNVLLRPPPPAGALPWQHYCRLVAVGFLIGLAACLIYDKLLSQLEDKWPWLKAFLQAPNGKDTGDSLHTEKLTLETTDKTSGPATRVVLESPKQTGQ